MMNRCEQMRAEAQRFHDEHPEVWRLFVHFTFDRINLGKKHYGAQAVLERVRWETDGGGGGQAFKINNNFVAFYARRFHAMYPLHGDFFRLRTQLSKFAPASDDPPLGPADYPPEPTRPPWLSP